MVRKRAASTQPQELEHVDDAWTYTCAVCGFRSSGWASKRKADERRRQHLAEHTHRAVMPELAELEERP